MMNRTCKNTWDKAEPEPIVNARRGGRTPPKRESLGWAVIRTEV
jgi:hypothetical protein